MITYSTNWMGPVALQWYKDRGLLDPSTGEITQRCCCGRIDIRGLPEDQYWNGWHEYDLPMMTEDSWSLFSEWLKGFKTEQLLTYDQIVEQYTKQTGNEMQYIK